MLKKLFVLIIYLLIFSRPAQAQGEFATDYLVSYTVNNDGSTFSRLEITLTNLQSNIYAKEFSLQIGSTRLSEIKAYTQSGPLEPQVLSGSKTTAITLPLNDKVLGKDKAQTLVLEYLSQDFSRITGSIREISLPKLAKSGDLRSYQLSLLVPQSFGPVSLINPRPSRTQVSHDYTVYHFRTEDLFDKGISAIFGFSQQLQFTFHWQLTNPNLFPVNTQITLAPDTAFQRVFYHSLNPAPLNVKTDPDGNWLAEYQLAGRQNLTVTATGSAEIFSQPQPGFSAALNPQLNYLAKQKFWETDNPKIVKLAQDLKTPQQIYQYLVDNLVYDFGRINSGLGRYGAANALDNPASALCTEFSDLFIALSRAAGVPARLIEGYAYTANASLRPLGLKNILHAWPEYYDQEQNLWRPVDPTWGNTTGGVDFFNQTDLNHFALVILGQDSQSPLPPDDVRISFGKVSALLPEIELKLDLPIQAMAGTTINGKLTVSNPGQAAVYRLPVNLSASGIVFPESGWEIPVLPPFAKAEYPVQIRPTAWNKTIKAKVSAAAGNTNYSQALTITPLYQYWLEKLYNLFKR